MASGDLRENQDRRNRLRSAADDILSGLDVLDGDPSPGEAVEARNDVQQAIRRAMLHGNVRRIGGLSTKVDA